jgi:hypothetical protein
VLNTDHVLLGDTLGDGDNKGDLGLNSLLNGRSGEGGGTYTTDALAPVSAIASATDAKIGRSK